MTGIDASKPQVARQREQIRRVALLCAGCLTGCVFYAAGLAYDNGTGVRIVAGVLGAGFAYLLARALRIAFIWDADGVHVRNMLRTRRLSWAQIERFEVRPSRGWGVPASTVARLTDGDLVTIHALSPAIIGVDPIRAQLAELNERLPPCSKPPGPAQ